MQIFSSYSKTTRPDNPERGADQNHGQHQMNKTIGHRFGPTRGNREKGEVGLCFTKRNTFI